MLASAPARAATASVSYTYDLAGRVIIARYDNDACVVYNYDAAGNRLTQTNTLAGAPETSTWGTGTWGCFNWTPHAALVTPPLARRPASARPAAGRF